MKGTVLRGWAALGLAALTGALVAAIPLLAAVHTLGAVRGSLAGSLPLPPEERAPGVAARPGEPVEVELPDAVNPEVEALAQASARVSDDFAAKAAAIVADEPRAVWAVSVEDLATGITIEVNPTDTMPSASTVKVDLVLAWRELLEVGAIEKAEAGETWASTAIIVSDNPSATALLAEIGGVGGLQAFWKGHGLTGTSAPAADWIDVNTTARDRRLLMRQLHRGDGIGPEARKALLADMSVIDPDQDWGVSEAGVAALKNGWLNHLWVTNSTGIVITDGGSTLAMAILSSGWSDPNEGVGHVQALAVAAAEVLARQG